MPIETQEELLNWANYHDGECKQIRAQQISFQHELREKLNIMSRRIWLMAMAGGAAGSAIGYTIQVVVEK